MLNFQPKDCLNPQDETIINGECKDNYIDPSTLPDFDSEQLGDSTGQTGACFDLGRCFAGAIDSASPSGRTMAVSGPTDASTRGRRRPRRRAAEPRCGPEALQGLPPRGRHFDRLRARYS